MNYLMVKLLNIVNHILIINKSIRKLFLAIKLEYLYQSNITVIVIFNINSIIEKAYYFVVLITVE